MNDDILRAAINRKYEVSISSGRSVSTIAVLEALSRLIHGASAMYSLVRRRSPAPPTDDQIRQEIMSIIDFELPNSETVLRIFDRESDE